MSNLKDFPVFAAAVHKRFTRMSEGELFTVDVEDLFTSYLLAFPEGTNPIYRKNTEHDCSCCKQFIRNMGRTVAIVGGKRVSVWGDGDDLPYPYNVVAAHLDALIQQAPIQSVFRTKERKFGAHHTIEMMEGGHAHRWHHFHGEVARRHQSPKPDADRGEAATTAAVLRRGLTELKPEAVETVIELVEQGTLYRGSEHLAALKGFQQLQRDYATASDPDLLIWDSIDKPAARFRNTAIGTLIQDLSEGMDLERAVRSFESKVAPMSYKRPKALITPRMVDSALETLRSLGLEDAIERRFARISDVDVTDVLFVDNEVRGKMKGGLRDLLMDATAPSAPKKTTAEPVTIQWFVDNLVPIARGIQLHLKNDHLPNFVSLTAPQRQGAGRLFKWDNGFAWSYEGDVADSIKERVKRAGGNTGAALRVSLAWHNYDDLDIHAECPDGHIYFRNKARILDVDMNAGSGTTRKPVENLSWVSPRNGTYTIMVNQWARRETQDGGFTLEVECGGVVQHFTCRANPSHNETIDCIEFTMKGGALTGLKALDRRVVGGSIPTEKWGVRTEAPVRVNTLLNSPNHWHGAGEIGAKHWIFALEGCRNPDSTRGIYNEFLRSDLEPHRKVFEVLGNKTKCPPAEEQISGVGFTAGRGDKVMVTATTNTGTRTYEISF